MLTVHVGLHKTGTTALQAYLKALQPRNRPGLEYLADDGLFYRDGFSPPGHSTRRSRSLQMLEAGKHVVLSNENFLGRSWSMYTDARDRATAMREYFDGVSEFQLVVYLRPQHTWFPSAHAQYVRAGGTENLQSYIRSRIELKYSRYSNLIRDLVDVFGSGRVVVRAYADGTDTVASFLPLIGLSVSPRLQGSERVNATTTQAHVEILRRINELSIDGHSTDFAWLLRKTDSGPFSSTWAPVDANLFSALLELTMSDWFELTELVRHTKLAEPQAFEFVANTAQSNRVPTTKSGLPDEPELEEAIRLLVTCMPLVRSHRLSLRTRLEEFLQEVRQGYETLWQVPWALRVAIGTRAHARKFHRNQLLDE